MSELILNSELLNQVLDGRSLEQRDILEIYKYSKNNPTELYKTSSILRKKYKGDIVTFSKKAFFNVVNLCADTCSYCTYKAEPNENKISMMTKDEILSLSKLAKKYRCTEALLVTGERPERKYDEAKEWLKKNGFNSTPEYLIHASETALNAGLFPHTNAGNITKKEMHALQDTNVSMGLMLESSSERLTEKDMPHHLAASKRPKERLKILENAGELKIPMTTGILVGIGESTKEMIESIFAIKKINDTFENIQEVILQNFQPKIDTKMNNMPAADEQYFKMVVALTRIIIPEMNIQIPPNLSPDSYQDFLSVGINDWGGISPLTPDYVNPEFTWPEIKRIELNSQNAGFKLEARFPIYPEFFKNVNSKLLEKMSEIKNENDFVKEDYWR